MSSEVEFAVIGGGVVGAGTAWNLADAGFQTLLLERHTIASGASGGGGHRGVRANGRDLRELPLARRAYELWPELSERLGVPVDYRRQGGFSLLSQGLAGSPHLDRVQARARVQRSFGIPTDVLTSHQQIAERLPGVARDADLAVYSPLDGIGDHTGTTRAYARAAAARGASIREGTRVLGLRTSGNATVLTLDDDEITVTKGVVLAANSYAPELLSAAFGIELPTWRFVPTYSLITAPEGFELDHLVSSVAKGAVVKHIEGRTLMISGGVRGWWDETADTGRHDLVSVGHNLAGAAGIFPALRTATVELVDASRPDTASVDDIPIIDRVPGTNVLYATGWSGHGFAIAPAVAEALASWVSSGVRPGALTPLSSERLSPLAN